MDKAWLEVVLKRRQHDESVAKIVGIEFESAVPKGENFVSTITRAKVVVLLASGRKTKKFFIVKEELTGKENDATKEMSPFKAELKMYKIFKSMEEIMDEFHDSNEILWANLIAFKEYSLIVFDDLTAKGFRVAKRSNYLDFNHGVTVLSGLGRFHAMSKVLLERGVASPDDFGRWSLIRDTPLGRNFYRASLNVFAKTMRSSWPKECVLFNCLDSLFNCIHLECIVQLALSSIRLLQFGTLEGRSLSDFAQLMDFQWVLKKKKLSKTADKIQKQANLANGKLKEIMDHPVKDDFLVINHGDLWICNIMFKYMEDGKTPNGLRFLDFQISHYNSYLFDIIYFTYSSLRPDLRRERMDELLTVYITSLTSSLKRYGYVGYIPTLADAKKGLDRLSYFAFIIRTVFHPIMTSESSDNFRIDKMCDDDKAEEGISPDSFRSEKFIKYVSEDLKFFETKGTI